MQGRQAPERTWGSLVWASHSHQGVGKTHYLLDGPSVIAEYNGLNVVSEQHNNNPQRIDEQFDLVQGGTKLWPICDGLGSVYAWVDRSGNVVGSYSYDVYGTRTQTSGTVNVAWGYTGREHDADTGLNYNRDRYLAPGFATWTQADRLGVAGGPNAYAYANLNAARISDPEGQYGEINSSCGLDATVAGGLRLEMRVATVEEMFMEFVQDDQYFIYRYIDDETGSGQIRTSAFSYGGLADVAGGADYYNFIQSTWAFNGFTGLTREGRIETTIASNYGEPNGTTNRFVTLAHELVHVAFLRMRGNPYYDALGKRQVDTWTAYGGQTETAGWAEGGTRREDVEEIAAQWVEGPFHVLLKGWDYQ